MIRSAALVFLIALSSLLWAQQPVSNGQAAVQSASLTSTTCPGSGCISVNTFGYSEATVTLHGTYAGVTIAFKFSDDGGTTYYGDTCTASNTAVQTNVFVLASNQSVAWFCPVYGTTQFEVVATAYTSGTVTANITLSNLPVNTTPIDSSNLVTTSGQSLTINSTTYSGKFALDVNLLGSDGTAFGTAGILDENVKQVGGSAVSTAATGVQLIGIEGHAGGVVDGVITAATAPVNGIVVMGVYDSTLPTLTTGQSAAVQVDTKGIEYVDVENVLGAVHSKTNSLFTALSDQTNVITAAISALGTAPTGTEVMAVNSVHLPSTAAGAALSSSIKSTVTASVNVKASAGNVYGFSVQNGAAAICWIQFINSSGAGTLGTAVIFSVALPSSGTVTFPPGALALANFSSGIAVGIASSTNSSTACGTGGNINVFYE